MHTLGRCHSLLRSFGCSPPPPSRRVGIARVSLFARLAQMDGQVFEPSLLSRSKEERPSASLRLRHSAPTPSRAGVWLTLANWRGKSVFFAFRRVNGDNETPFARDFERGFDAERNGDAPPPPPRARSFFERRNEKGTCGTLDGVIEATLSLIIID